MGTLNLGKCDSYVVNNLPNGMHVRGDLEFYKETIYPLVEKTPENLKVSGDLNIKAGIHLTEISEGITVGGTVDLFYCTNLLKLPKSMRVGGNMNLGCCENLGVLPSDMKIGKSLNLQDCKKIENIPSDLQIGGTEIYILSTKIKFDNLIERIKEKIARHKFFDT